MISIVFDSVLCKKVLFDLGIILLTKTHVESTSIFNFLGFLGKTSYGFKF